jgi:hypothetical protein
MAVLEKPRTFKTTDGREFTDEAEAKLHDELIVAREAFDAARRRLNNAVLKTQRTADGQLFDFGLFRDYHYVRPGYGGMPSMQTVSFLGWNFEISEHTDAVEIIDTTISERRPRYAIASLYLDKRAANIALHLEQVAWLKERAAEIEKEKEKLLPPTCPKCCADRIEKGVARAGELCPSCGLSER